MGLLDGKVAFITGAARGQGRSHALRLAREGASIIACDICAQIDTVPYQLAQPVDLETTVKLVEQVGGRIVARQADVRRLPELEALVAEGLEKLHRLDIVVANAGIAPMKPDSGDMSDVWRDVIDVNLTGAYNTVAAALPTIVKQGTGGSIVLVSSTGGLKGFPMRNTANRAYVSSKHGLVGLMRSLANELASMNIRVNSIHPTGVRTGMADNDYLPAVMEANTEFLTSYQNTLPIDMLEPEDISDALIWLVSDSAKYITGITLPVDAGFTNRC